LWPPLTFIRSLLCVVLHISEERSDMTLTPTLKVKYYYAYLVASQVWLRGTKHLIPGCKVSDRSWDLNAKPTSSIPIHAASFKDLVNLFFFELEVLFCPK
jgi:hypothetical protein